MSLPSPKEAWLAFQRSRVGRSIFRVGLPGSNLERAQAMISSFLLHVQPAKVRRRTLRFGTTLGLGTIALYLLAILVGTGVLLMFYYVPATDRAYDAMKDLQFVVSAGLVIRNMHRWAAHLMVAVVMLHLCRVFYTGAYQRPREFNWIIGIGLFVLTLALSFTGYLLPWDQLAYWAITVGANIAAYAPIVGPKLKFLLLGGHVVGQDALIRFYTLHVAVLPGAIGLLVALHLWRVRKDGGLAHPDEPDNHVQVADPDHLPANKTYGLMELARGTSPLVGIDPADEVFSWPNLVFREILLFLAVVAVVLCLAIFWNAPLEEIANSIHPPNPAKAPWYFLGLQELVSYSALWGGVIAPAVLLGGLAVLPYLTCRSTAAGQWFAPKRWRSALVFTVFLVAIAILTVIGSFFRGPNWGWVKPWDPPPAAQTEP